jgi:hypothetical protein
MLTQEQEIRNWLDKMKITRYTIHEDLTVDVEGNVNLSGKEIIRLPVQFGVIDGAFVISGNGLTTLKGCPHTILGNFWCNTNRLKNLQFGPTTVTGSYNCGYNQINTLEYLPDTMKEGLDCSHNRLTILKGLEKFDKLYHLFANNNQLTSLQYVPKEIDYALHFENNQVKNFDHLPQKIQSLNCANNPVSPDVIDAIQCMLSVFKFNKTAIRVDEVVEMNFLKNATIIFSPQDLPFGYQLDDNGDNASLSAKEIAKIQLKNRLEKELAQDGQNVEENTIHASPKFKL